MLPYRKLYGTVIFIFNSLCNLFMGISTLFSWDLIHGWPDLVCLNACYDKTRLSTLWHGHAYAIRFSDPIEGR